MGFGWWTALPKSSSVPAHHVTSVKMWASNTLQEGRHFRSFVCTSPWDDRICSGDPAAAYWKRKCRICIGAKRGVFVRGCLKGSIRVASRKI
jgi:hypothetical protein